MAMMTGRANHKGGKSKSGRNFSSSLKFIGKCNHCNKRGHKEDQGWTKHPELKLEKSRRDERNEKPKFAMMATLATAQVPKRKSGKEDFRPFEWGFTLLV